VFDPEDTATVMFVAFVLVDAEVATMTLQLEAFSVSINAVRGVVAAVLVTEARTTRVPCNAFMFSSYVLKKRQPTKG
jgi:hypothetical protein